MARLYRKKAIALYETRLRIGYVVMTVVFYLLAAVLWYIFAAIAPYTATVCVTKEQNSRLTFEALSATSDQQQLSDELKEHALLMPTGESSFCRRLKLIEDARQSIDVVTFFGSDSKFSEYFYTALFRAADRGVKVRIVQDGKLGRLDGNIADKLANILHNHNNIEVYYFNNINILNPGGLMTILHDKVMAVDGDKMIVGGANMGSSGYMSNYDMEVMVTNSGAGGSVGQMEKYVENMLKSELTERYRAKKRDFSAKSEYEMEYLRYYENSEFYGAEIDYGAQGVAVDKITYLTNPVSDTKKAPIIMQAMFNLMEHARKTVVVTPYTLLQNDKIERLRAAAGANDEFTLITNSLYNTRNMAYADYYSNRDKYLNCNIKLLEYQAKNQLHAKLFSFDDRISVVGSFNMDERSAHIDTESVVVIDSPAFNAVLNDYIAEVFCQNSLQVGNDNKYLPSDTVKPGKTPDSKLTRYRFYSLIGIVRCVI